MGNRPDGLSHTLHLREGVVVRWHAVHGRDVARFSVRVGTDPKVSSVASSLQAGGKPIALSVVGSKTVRVEFAGPVRAGSARCWTRCPSCPGTSWNPRTPRRFARRGRCRPPPADVVGLGPFVFASYEPGQRVVLERNPALLAHGG
jgi:ABC-type transport system substrate-binding protein